MSPGQMLIIDISYSVKNSRVWTRLYVSCHNDQVTVLDVSAGRIGRLSFYDIPYTTALNFEDAWDHVSTRIE